MSAGHNVGFRVFTRIRRPPQALIEGSLGETGDHVPERRDAPVWREGLPYPAAHPEMRMAGPAAIALP
jgi:hypothetical protein